jgi:hypothetical protein
MSKPKKYQGGGPSKMPSDSVITRMLKEKEKGYLPANDNERLMVEKERAKMKAEKDKNIKESAKQVKSLKKG